MPKHIVPGFHDFTPQLQKSRPARREPALKASRLEEEKKSASQFQRTTRSEPKGGCQSCPENQSVKLWSTIGVGHCKVVQKGILGCQCVKLSSQMEAGLFKEQLLEVDIWEAQM